MADIRLVDIVLLQFAFEMWPDRPDASKSDSSETDTQDDETELGFDYPEEDIVELQASSSREGDEFVLYLRATLDDERLPFKMELLLGGRYSFRDLEESVEEVEPTLVWLAYPYLREVIVAATTRSPAPPYFLPPMSYLPHPSVLREQNS